MLKELPSAVLRSIEAQPDRRRDTRGSRGRDYSAVDLRREKDLRKKAPAQQAVRLGEQAGTLDPNDAVVREGDFDVDVRAEITADWRVIHDPVPPSAAIRLPVLP